MPLFPEQEPRYLDEKDRDIRARIEAFYQDSIMINQAFWNEASIDSRFFAGDQTIFSDLYGAQPLNRRRQFNFNRIRRIVNMISGHQRKNRKSSIVTPVENSDQLTADQFTKIFMWVNQQEGVLESISSAFEGALITGLNLLQVWIDYRNDPLSGNIKIDVCPYNAFVIDPYFKKQDLSDCSAIWKRSFLTRKEVVSLLPQYADTITSLYGYSTKDGKFPFMPENYNMSRRDLLTYDEYYYRDLRKQKMLLDTQTGETTEWQGNDEDLAQFLSMFNAIKLVEQDIPTVKMALLVGGKVIYDGPNPLGIDDYPFAPCICYYHPEIQYFPLRIQSVVRNLRDAQFLYNRRRVIELDTLESQMTSGWIYKEDALVNPSDIFMAGQGRGLALKAEAQMTDVQQIVPPQIPPTTIQLSELLGKEIQEISGVNEELLGSATDDKAGILSMLRQGSALTTLQTLFDQLDFTQKQLGKIMIKVIQNNFTPGKVKRILGAEPSQKFYDKTFGRYDCVVEDGINTSTQKQMQFAQMLHLREAGIPIPDDVIIEASTMQNKDKLMQSLQQQAQQAQQMQQQQQQLEMAELQARIKVAESTATANQGLGIERMSRVQENQALAEERRAAAIKDQDLALLNLIKAAKELEGMDYAHIESLINMAKSLEEPQEQVLNQTLEPHEKATKKATKPRTRQVRPTSKKT